MWNKIFRIIQNAGLNFAWLDLMCRPPPGNATEIVQQAQQQHDEQIHQYEMIRPTRQSSNKVSDGLLTPILNILETPLQKALFAQKAMGKYTDSLRFHIRRKLGVF